MTFDAESFLERLSRLSLPTIFNQYREVCPIHDSPESPAIRRRNLVAYINAQLAARPGSVWVGEAGGYRGLRRTGLLLTSENWLATASTRLGVCFRKATVTPPQAEISAGAVWREIARLPQVPFIWAAIPLHPHRPGMPLSNRNPTVQEVRAFLPFLEELLAVFSPQQIVAIGRIAQRALADLGIEAAYVRHPAMAGIPEFRRGIQRLYGLETTVEPPAPPRSPPGAPGSGRRTPTPDRNSR